MSEEGVTDCVLNKWWYGVFACAIQSLVILFIDVRRRCHYFFDFVEHGDDVFFFGGKGTLKFGFLGNGKVFYCCGIHKGLEVGNTTIVDVLLLGFNPGFPLWRFLDLVVDSDGMLKFFKL